MPDDRSRPGEFERAEICVPTYGCKRGERVPEPRADPSHARSISPDLPNERGEGRFRRLWRSCSRSESRFERPNRRSTDVGRDSPRGRGRGSRWDRSLRTEAPRTDAATGRRQRADEEPDVEAHSGPVLAGRAVHGRAGHRRSGHGLTTAPSREIWARADARPGLPLMRRECRARSSRSLGPPRGCSSSSASTAAARRATTSSSPPPPPEERLGLPRLEEEVDRDRGLVREQAEQLHLLQAEERLLRTVEDREHAERPFVVQQRRGHEPFRDVAGALCDVARDQRGSLWTSSMTRGVRVASTQPAIPVPAGKRVPSSVSSPSPTTASKTSSSVSGSSSRIDEARAPKIDRATSTMAARSARKESSEPTTPAATAARRSGRSVMSHPLRWSRSDRARS